MVNRVTNNLTAEQAFPYTIFQPQALELCARVGTLTSGFCLVLFLYFLYMQ